MSDQIHVDDIGTQLIVTVYDDGQVVNISNSSTMTITIKKPDGVIINKVGLLYTDGSDGKMYCVSNSGDFDISGNYKIQGRITLNGGTYYTSVGSFRVYCNI